VNIRTIGFHGQARRKMSFRNGRWSGFGLGYNALCHADLSAFEKEEQDTLEIQCS
jgi:hypothetical protein